MRKTTFLLRDQGWKARMGPCSQSEYRIYDSLRLLLVKRNSGLCTILLLFRHSIIPPPERHYSNIPLFFCHYSSPGCQPSIILPVKHLHLSLPYKYNKLRLSEILPQFSFLLNSLHDKRYPCQKPLKLEVFILRIQQETRSSFRDYQPIPEFF